MQLYYGKTSILDLDKKDKWGRGGTGGQVPCPSLFFGVFLCCQWEGRMGQGDRYLVPVSSLGYSFAVSGKAESGRQKGLAPRNVPKLCPQTLLAWGLMCIPYPLVS